MRHRFTLYVILLLGIIPFISLSACTGLLELVSEPGPDIQWSRTFGDGRNVWGNSVQQTTDGGYILCGRTETPSEERVAWLIKTDADGNKIWDKIFNPGVDGEAEANSVQQTKDGGYILCGTVVTKETGIWLYYIWLIKTDAGGNKMWDKLFVGSQRGASGHSVQQTTDGSYIICGRSDDYLWLMKTDAEGNTIWDKTFVARHMDQGNSVQQTTDGGYIVCGWSRPLIEGWIVGKPNVWLIKTDADGNKLWDKMFGGELYAEGASVQQTMDGGYIICGVGETEKNIGALSQLLLKTDANGNEVWYKIFNRGYGYSAKQTIDGGYILCGKTRLHTGWVIKTDAEGNKLWNKRIGKGFAWGSSVQQTADGGYVICGSDYSAGANHVLLVKIAPEQ
jgi:hypothetical protein